MKLFGFFHIADPWTLDNWRATLGDPVLLRSLWNTIAIGLGAGVSGCCSTRSSLTWSSRPVIAAGGLLDFLSWLPWSIPGILLGVALLWTFLQTENFSADLRHDLSFDDRHVIKSMPFGTQMIKSVLIQLGSDLEEASKVCGGTWLHTFRRVIFPLICRH